MHEFSIVQSLLDVAVAETRRAGAQRVLRLNCRIGELRQINESLLREAFELLSRGTLCENAELCVEKTFMQARCRACERLFEVHNWNWRCPDCGGDGSLAGGGDELELTSIEAEKPE
jgi:hydrogenase nickel incorporation protein HypA/HybF